MFSRSIFAIAALVSLSAFAEGDYEANTIDTLHYRPARNTFNLNTNLESPIQDSWQQSQSGTNSFQSERSYLESNSTLNYGITDSWIVSASVSYMFQSATSQTANNNPGVAAEGFQSSGFSDPTLHVSYRFLGDLVGGFFGQAFLNYLPSFGTSRTSISGFSDGNDLAGRTETQVGAQFYWVCHDHEFGAAAEGEYFGNGTDEDLFNENNTSHVDSYWRYLVTGNYRYHFSPRFYGNVGANLYFPVQYEEDSSNRDRNISTQMWVNPSLTLGWHVIPGTVVFLEYSMDSYSSYETATKGSSFDPVSTNYMQQYLSVGGLFEL